MCRDACSGCLGRSGRPVYDQSGGPKEKRSGCTKTSTSMCSVRLKLQETDVLPSSPAADSS